MNLTEEQETTLSQALDKWGYDAQIDMCIEECSELIQALCKYKRVKNDSDSIWKIKDEIADVFITVKQMVMIFEGKSIDGIQSHIDFKVRRLEERLKS